MFNNSENYRTVLTHVERGTYCYIFIYIVVLHTISIVKDYYGPFPSILCWWLKWTFKFVPAGILLSFSVNILIRVSLKLKNAIHCLYVLAYMATSGGHFSRPSGMGGYWSYSG